MCDERKKTCPLCMEEMDLTDQQLKPCLCGYEICLWCWHHIMENAEKDDTEGRCPACRSPYDKERILMMTISRERLAKLNFVKKQKLQKPKPNNSETKKYLSNFRVILRNLVYIAGLPVDLADKEILQKNEFLGQYGKVLKVVLTRVSPTNQHFFSNNSCSVYVTFSKDEEAIRCIQVVDGFMLDGRPLKACYGTTKYCSAWLKNMPCGNPDCIYLHDVGKQEDICPKDEVASACISKVQQTVGITSTGLQQRSGSLFPPPLDGFCSKANTTMSKPLARLAVSSPVDHEKSFLPHNDSEKCGFLPASASWGLRVSSDRSSSKSAAAIQGPADNKPCTSGCFSTGMEVEIPMQAEDAFHWEKQNVILRNHAPPSYDVLWNISSSKPCDMRFHSSHSTASFDNANPGTDAFAEYAVKESSSFLMYDDMDRGTTQVPCSSDANGFYLPFPTSLVADAAGLPPFGETTKLSSLILHSSSNGTDARSPCLRNCRCNFSPAQQPVASSLKDNIGLPMSMNLHSRTNSADVDSNNLLPIQHSVATSKDIHMQSLEKLTPAPKQPVATSRYTPVSYEVDDVLGVWISSTNPDTNSLSLLSNPEIHGDDSPFYPGGSVMNNKIGEFPLTEIVNASISPKGECEKLSSTYSGYNGDDLKFCHLDYECQKIPSLVNKEWAWDPNVCDKVKNGAREASVISDILSLNLGLDDPFISHHGPAKPSLASVNYSSKMSREANYLGVDEFGQKDYSTRRDIVDNDAIYFSKPFNGAVCNSKNSKDFTGESCLFPKEVSQKSKDQPNLHQSDSLTLRMPEVSSLPRPLARKSALRTPPGFCPRHVDKDQSSMLSSPGSSVHPQFSGNSPQLNLRQKITGHGSHVVEQTDLSTGVCNRGKLPLSNTNMILPKYCPEASSSEIGQRLEFSRLQSGDMSQNGMITTEGCKYSPLHDSIWNDNRSWSAHLIGSPTATDSALLGRRDRLGSAEMTNNGRINSLGPQPGCLRPFHPSEYSKFQMSNSSFFYNSLFERS